MANRQEQIKELTDRLEEGVREVFESDKYEDYLRVMSKFYNYSYRNTLLIALQKPDATLVAGYEAWKKKFGRQVNKGEKAIKILAPAPYKTKKEMEVIDQVTQRPVMLEDGTVMTEEVEVTIPAFRVANVFDISQTTGRPLPSLFDNIEGDVRNFERFFEAVKSVSPVPVGFEPMADKDGFYHQVEKRIALRDGMSERQTMAAIIHEISHATLHALDMEHLQESLKERGKDQRTMEVEAESIAYVVCQHYGIETGENSFGYIAMWSKNKTLPELQASLKVIRDTSSDLIGRIDEKVAELEKVANQELKGERDKEEELLNGEGKRYGIYQIEHGARADDFKFTRKAEFDRQGIKVLREDYKLVYSGMMGEGDSLDSIYEKFNMERPEDFKGHSLSVSDIVVIHEDGKNTAYFVDSFGFQEIQDFLNMSEERVYSLAVGEKPEKFFSIQQSEEGFDYSFYDANYKLLDGGIITNADQPMENAIRDILTDAGLQIEGRVEDTDDFMDRVAELEKAEIAMAAVPAQKESVAAESGRTLEHIEFYVAECEEFHDMGEFRTYPDIESAVKKYQEILDDPRKLYKGNGMGIIYHGGKDDIYNNSECCLVSKRVVCGNELDQIGLGEKSEVREVLRMLHEAFPDFHYKMPKYEKEAGVVLMSAEDLAVRIDRLVQDFAPYHYPERLDGQKSLVQDITYSLYTGGKKHYLFLLDEMIRGGGSLATEADKLREQLLAFEPVVSVDKEPVVRVNSCDSKEFTFEKYMPIDAFDDAVKKMDLALSERNAGKAENKIETGTIQFTVYYPDDGKMAKLREAIDVGYGDGGFFSTLRCQVEDRLTDENWIAYESGKGQAALDKFVSTLTNIKDSVLPHLQSFCRGSEGVQVYVETADIMPAEMSGKSATEVSYSPDNSGKGSRNGTQTAHQNGRRSIHDRLASNKAKIEKQSGKGNPVKGVERTC